MTGLDWIGEILEGKIGGANVCAKKTPCERDPLRELHGLQALTKFSRLIAMSGCLDTGII
jgi:hypothetical protein